MPADQIALPKEYTAANVIGVTKGSPRWTVYFDDFGRYTQMHPKEDNIGYHLPPMKELFAANITDAEKKFLKASVAKMKTTKEKFALINAFAEAWEGRDVKEGMKLFELKLRSDDGKVKMQMHPSRSALVEVSKVEATQLVADIRRRGPKKESIKQGPLTLFRFVDPG